MNAMVNAWRDVFRRGRWWPPTLAFDEVQEQRFISATREARFTHFIRSGWVGLLCYNLFCFSDSLMAPDVIDEALKIRLLGFTPLAMAVLLISTVARDWVLSWRDGVIEAVVISSAMLAALSLVWILTSSHTEVAPLYRSGLVPIVVFGNLVLRFRFKGAVWFTVLILVVYGLSVALHWGRSTPYAAFEIPQFLFVSAIGLYTLVINFRIEMEERRRFQRSESSAAARARLEASQRELDALARRDPLTGVPNRRHLDDYLLQQWQAPGNQGLPLSVLLIDVDHFKAFNDRHGHPAGDQCLTLLAQALARTVGPVQGLLARWGGEEFVAVLPHTTVRQAAVVAEGLREAVEALNLRHEAAPLRRVTISVGVATWPADGEPDTLERVLAMADGALYQAKSAGRNCCRMAPGHIEAD